jgi:hypothetical protein
MSVTIRDTLTTGIRPANRLVRPLHSHSRISEWESLAFASVTNIESSKIDSTPFHALKPMGSMLLQFSGRVNVVTRRAWDTQ